MISSILKKSFFCTSSSHLLHFHHKSYFCVFHFMHCVLSPSSLNEISSPSIFQIVFFSDIITIIIRFPIQPFWLSLVVCSPCFVTLHILCSTVHYIAAFTYVGILSCTEEPSSSCRDWRCLGLLKWQSGISIKYMYCKPPHQKRCELKSKYLYILNRFQSLIVFLHNRRGVSSNFHSNIFVAHLQSISVLITKFIFFYIPSDSKRIHNPYLVIKVPFRPFSQSISFQCISWAHSTRK